MSFGVGSRMCIGKHLGLIQVHSVVATLALRYDMELARPEREWKVINRPLQVTESPTQTSPLPSPWHTIFLRSQCMMSPVDKRHEDLEPRPRCASSRRALRLA